MRLLIEKRKLNKYRSLLRIIINDTIKHLAQESMKAIDLSIYLESSSLCFRSFRKFQDEKMKTLAPIRAVGRVDCHFSKEVRELSENKASKFPIQSKR